MAEIEMTTDDKEADLKRWKQSLRMLRKHDGYERFSNWTEFLLEAGVSLDEIEKHLTDTHKACTPLIYGHEYGMGSPNQRNARFYQMIAAVEDMKD